MKRSVSEILELPIWERAAWKLMFDVAGPLDWERDDLAFGRVYQYFASDGEPLAKKVLFPPLRRPPVQTEEDVLALFSGGAERRFSPARVD